MAGIEGTPALLVEVLSPGNPTTDTDVKRHAYARAGVPEYWIVRPGTRDILVLSIPDSALGDYTSSRRVAVGETLVSATLPIAVPVADVFAGLPAGNRRSRSRRRGHASPE